jgi:hypothetical protein
MMRWTDDELAAHQARVGLRGSRSTADVSAPPFKIPGTDAGRFALGRLPIGTMNKTEAAYDEHLKSLHHTGEVIWHKFEAVKLRLADNTFYTCDFAVLPASGVLEMHEVKGFWQDDAKVKIKVAASIYPFRFIVVKARAKKNGGGWEREEFS